MIYMCISPLSALLTVLVLISAGMSSAQIVSPDAFTTRLPCTIVPRTFATFQCISIELSDIGAGEAMVCYRPVGSENWLPALSLWYDSRNQEHRGSLVNLQPDTEYQLQVMVGDQLACVTTRTLSEIFPVAKTTDLGNRNGEVRITEGGTAQGYHLVVGGTITGGENNLVIDAPYVIVRGLTLRDAENTGIKLGPDANHIVIERNEITGFGSIRGDGDPQDPTRRYWGNNASQGNSGIWSDRGHNLIIQYNHIHTPRSDSNGWRVWRPTVNSDQGSATSRCPGSSFPSPASPFCHPEGPQAITIRGSILGQNIIRYNSLVGTSSRMWNDAIGGFDNFKTRSGCPGPNSDIYGNFITGFQDEGIESEGINRNVRIWGNVLYAIVDDGNEGPAVAGVGLSVVHDGPLYAWKNILEFQPGTVAAQAVKAQSRIARKPTDDVNRLSPSDLRNANKDDPFGTNLLGGGRVYFFHNTIIATGNGYRSSGSRLFNVHARNNIIQARGVAFEEGGYYSTFDHNLYTGSSPDQPNGIVGSPTFQEGTYALTADSLGVDRATFIPGITTRGDMGALGVGETMVVGHRAIPVVSAERLIVNPALTGGQ